MYKILILTTRGCEACNIAKRNVELAISQTSTEIELEYKDWKEENSNFIKKNKIKDFPTAIYFIDDKVIHKAVGTYPSPVYLRWMDMYFKN